MLAAAGPDKRSAGQDSLARSQAIPDAKVGDAEQAVEAGSKVYLMAHLPQQPRIWTEFGNANSFLMNESGSKELSIMARTE